MLNMTAQAWRKTKDTNNVLLGHDQDVLAIAVDPRGRFIASAGKDRRLKLWDTKNGELLTQQPEFNENVIDKKAIEDGYVHKSSIYDIAISQNGEYLASTGNDAVIVIWKIIKVDGEVTLSDPHKITEHEGPVRAVDFNPEDNHQLVSGGDDGTLRLWKVETEKAKPGKIKHQAIDAISAHDNSIQDVSFSHDGKTIVSGSTDKTIRVWDTETRKQLLQMAHKDTVFSVAFNSTGDRIVSGSADRSVRIWDAKDGKPTGESLKGHDGRVYSAIFSADNRAVISTGSDRTIRFWDVNTGRAISTIPEAHSSLIWDLALMSKEAGQCEVFLEVRSAIAKSNEHSLPFRDGNVRDWLNHNKQPVQLWNSTPALSKFCIDYARPSAGTCRLNGLC